MQVSSVNMHNFTVADPLLSLLVMQGFQAMASDCIGVYDVTPFLLSGRFWKDS